MILFIWNFYKFYVRPVSLTWATYKWFSLSSISHGVVSRGGLVVIFISIFSSHAAEIPMFGSSVNESEEFLMVNLIWVLGVNSRSSLFKPSPLFSGKGVIHGSSEPFNTVFHFFDGEGPVMVGIKCIEGIIGLFLVNTWFSLVVVRVFLILVALVIVFAHNSINLFPVFVEIIEDAT